MMPQPAESRTVVLKRSHRKVKSGCRTCKIRKVKCDEGWPACRVCVSTGRICDGYGIWGGGGSRHGQRAHGTVPAKNVIIRTSSKLVEATRCIKSIESLGRRSLFASAIQLSDAEEYLHLQFFEEQTLAKVPGLYSTKYNNLWGSLVIQACANEPAVLHAVLAISSAHRRKMLDGPSRNKVLVNPDKREEFLLRNYCKSIQYLQPRYHDCGEHSMRTTLITCLVFVYLELLRGIYKRAYDHLEGGLKVLTALNCGTSKRKAPRPSSALGPALDSDQDRIDVFLAEAFARLRVQMEFSGLRSGTGSTVTPKPSSSLTVIRFSSFQEARHYLDRAFDGINGVSQAIRDGSYTTWPDEYWTTALTERRFMQGALDSWLRSYTATLAHSVGTMDHDELTGYKMLRVYHTMAEIMAATCLSPKQMIFDEYIAAFRSIVTQCNDIASNGEPTKHACRGPRLPTNGRYSWPDISWLPPLYFTAIKCRDSETRKRAVDLMSLFWRYEIVWDLGILNVSSLVAKEVIRMEETNPETVSPPGNLKYERDTPPSALPEGRRLDTVEIILLDNGSRNMVIVCGKWDNLGLHTVRKTYDEVEEVWTTVEGEPAESSTIPVK